MSSIFESEKILKLSRPFKEVATKIGVMFPDLEWDLKKADLKVEPADYLMISAYIVTVAFLMFFVLMGLLTILFGGDLYSFLIPVVFTMFVAFYFVILPKSKINQRGRQIDNNLEYMLKDMRIQLSSGIPLFNTMVNISRGGYGECSVIADRIVKEVQSGKSITDVLDDAGMGSPSEYLRRALWQVVNAIRSGTDITVALDAISKDIRIMKENRIKMYGQELNMLGLVYMIVAIVLPSMGVTLLVILSSFLGGKSINETILWGVLIAVILLQVILISFIRSKRPQL